MKINQIKFISGCLFTAIVLAFTLVTGACSSDRTTLTGIVPRKTTTTTTQTTTTATLVSIKIDQATPVRTTLGNTVQFTATGTYSDGTTGDCTYDVVWNSSDTAIATIGYTGLATTVTRGTVQITAAINGIISNAVDLVISPVATATLTSISVSRTVVADLAVGKTEQFTALGSSSDGTTKDITSQVTWSSTETDVATISASGLATGLKPGQTDISATLSGVISNDITITVVSP
jgi:hypothetical protein